MALARVLEAGSATVKVKVMELLDQCARRYYADMEEGPDVGAHASLKKGSQADWPRDHLVRRVSRLCEMEEWRGRDTWWERIDGHLCDVPRKYMAHRGVVPEAG